MGLLDFLKPRVRGYTTRGYRPYVRPHSWTPAGRPRFKLKIKGSAGRVAYVNARAPFPRLFAAGVYSRLSQKPMLTQLEDRRRYHPLGIFAPPVGFNRIASETHRNIIGPDRRIPFAPHERKGFEWRQWKIANRPLLWKIMAERSPENRTFGQPSRLAICLRRWLRRRMMFASGNAGRNPSLFKRPSFGPFSMVQCLKGVD